MTTERNRVSNPADGVQNEPFYQFMDLTGDGTGTDDFIADYSSFGNDEAYLTPAAGTIYRVARMIVSIEDGTGMTWDKYGGITALSTGLTLTVKNASGTIYTLTPDAIKTNAMWGQLCYDADIRIRSSGNDLFQARWTFAKSGQFIRLDGNAGEFMELTLRDNFGSLTHHRFMMQGYKEYTPT